MREKVGHFLPHRTWRSRSVRRGHLSFGPPRSPRRWPGRHPLPLAAARPQRRPGRQPRPSDDGWDHPGARSRRSPDPSPRRGQFTGSAVPVRGSLQLVALNPNPEGAYLICDGPSDPPLLSGLGNFDDRLRGVSMLLANDRGLELYAPHFASRCRRRVLLSRLSRDISGGNGAMSEPPPRALHHQVKTCPRSRRETSSRPVYGPGHRFDIQRVWPRFEDHNDAPRHLA